MIARLGERLSRLAQRAVPDPFVLVLLLTVLVVLLAVAHLAGQPGAGSLGAVLGTVLTGWYDGFKSPAGLAFAPVRWFNFAVDADLNEIDSVVVRSIPLRYGNAGVEFLAGDWFSARFGAYRNLAFDNAETILTAGLGFGFARFSIDVALAASTSRVGIESDEDGLTLPSGLGAGIQLS